jgi:hypothetical protein
MSDYRTDTPKIGTWAWCWYHAEYVYACWTGACWLDEQDRRLVGVTHWKAA